MDISKAFCLLTTACIGLCMAAAGAVAASGFEFTLARPTMTSAGVYDTEGRLVRTLWAMERLPAGRHRRDWDGVDGFGERAPAGEYRVRVLLNGTVYRNVGAIGNSGKPPSAAGHIPTNMESVAVDRDGNIYTANGWDEAGADFKKWTPEGESVYDARYQMRNGNPNGAPYAITTDEEYIYCTMGGWAREPWNSRQQVQRFRLTDGGHVKFTEVGREDGHINVHEWPEKQIPEGTPPEDAALMKHPLRAVAVSGEAILVADALGGRVLRYHKVTGRPLSEFPVELPQALAVDGEGRIWVGHGHKLVSVFEADGGRGRRVLSGLGEVEALAFGPGGRLYVADSAAGQVKVYDVARRKARLVRTLGRKAAPGDRAPDRFFRLRGAAVDGGGHVVTIQTEPVGGARLARWSPEGKLLWEHFGNEFVSLGNYGASQPDVFYSMSFHRYRLLDPSAGAWEYVGNVYPGGKRYVSHAHGVIRVLRLKGRDFVFVPTGEGVQVYRVAGRSLRLAALVGGADPDPEGENNEKRGGKWSWHDASGSGRPTPDSINWYRKPGTPGAQLALFGMDVDRRGDIWFAELHSHAIWTIRLGSYDRRGNPVYDWAKARQAVPRDASALGFDPTMAQRADDGSIYAFGWSKAWPSPKGNPFWMGGTTLVKFDAEGARLWAVELPEVCVGLDTVPAGAARSPGALGCMVGGGRKSTIYHYTQDGLLMGRMAPGEAMCNQSGWFDNHASVAVNRDPRDRILDVFAEDDYTLRIAWYRVDDRDIRTIEVRLSAP